MRYNWRWTFILAERRWGNDIASFGDFVRTLEMSVMRCRFLLDSVVGFDDPFEDIVVTWSRSGNRRHSIRLGVSREDGGSGKELRCRRWEIRLWRAGQGGGQGRVASGDDKGGGGGNCGHGRMMEVWLFGLRAFRRTTGQPHILCLLLVGGGSGGGRRAAAAGEKS